MSERKVEVKTEGYSVPCVRYAFSRVTSQASDSVLALYKKTKNVIVNVR